MFSDHNISEELTKKSKKFLLKYIDFIDITDKFGEEVSEEIRLFLTYDCDELTDCYESPCFKCFKPKNEVYLGEDSIIERLWDLGDEGTDKVPIDDIYKKCLIDNKIISEKTFTLITTNIKGTFHTNIVTFCSECWDTVKDRFDKELIHFVKKN